MRVRIKFETFNDYNFLIDVSGNDRKWCLAGTWTLAGRAARRDVVPRAQRLITSASSALVARTFSVS